MVNKRERINMYRASKSLTTLLKMNEGIEKGGNSMETKTNKIEIRKADWFEMQQLNDLVVKAGKYYTKAEKIIDTCYTVLLDEKVRKEIIENAYVVVLNKEIIGLATVWNKHKTIISNLYIRPEYRRKGYGRSLLEYVTKDIDDVVIVVEHKRDTYGFYKKLGFSICYKEIISNNKLLKFIKKGDSMKIRVITINNKDYLLIDKKDIVNDKELRHILLSIKKCFDFLEENRDLYKCLNNVEYSENVRLDCVKNLLSDKYKDDVVLIKEEDIERIETGIYV